MFTWWLFIGYFVSKEIKHYSHRLHKHHGSDAYNFLLQPKIKIRTVALCLLLCVCLQQLGILCSRYWSLLEIDRYYWILEAFWIIGEPWWGSNHIKLSIGKDICEKQILESKHLRASTASYILYSTAGSGFCHHGNLAQTLGSSNVELNSNKA